MVRIDYFMRKVIKSKQGLEIVTFLKDLCTQGKKPEEIITDNGKEFCNEQMRKLCNTVGIEHRKVSLESYRSNGRIESEIVF